MTKVTGKLQALAGTASEVSKDPLLLTFRGADRKLEFRPKFPGGLQSVAAIDEVDEKRLELLLCGVIGLLRDTCRHFILAFPAGYHGLCDLELSQLHQLSTPRHLIEFQAALKSLKDAVNLLLVRSPDPRPIVAGRRSTWRSNELLQLNELRRKTHFIININILNGLDCG